MNLVPYMLAFTLATVSPLCARAMEIPRDAAQSAKPATIKVLLQEEQGPLLLEVKGAYKLFCPYTNVLISSSSHAKRDYLHKEENGLVFGGLIPGSYALRIVPADKETTIFVNGIQYKGCLEVYDIQGALRVINEVDVENYLRSSLSTKFCNITEPEVLNALSIIARTHAYYLIQKEEKAPWHTTAQESGYTGFATTLQHLPLEQAISQTRYAILTYKEQPFAACYTENSAGKTASFSSVFRKKVLSPNGVILSGMESERQKSAWSFQVSKGELASLLKLNNINSLSVFADKTSDKVYAVKVEHEMGAKTVDFEHFQEALGKNRLRSNDFTVEISSQFVRFKGYGEGNGVGLCLHTADLMAKQGLDAKRILSEFFSETALERVKLPQKSEGKHL